MSNTPSRPRYTGSIRWADEMIPTIKRGIVLINGNKATILDRDVGDGNKPQQVDVMRNVTVNETNGEVTLNGESLYAIKKIRATDSQVEVIVELQGCKNC